MGGSSTSGRTHKPAVHRHVRAGTRRAGNALHASGDSQPRVPPLPVPHTRQICCTSSGAAAGLGGLEGLGQLRRRLGFAGLWLRRRPGLLQAEVGQQCRLRQLLGGEDQRERQRAEDTDDHPDGDVGGVEDEAVAQLLGQHAVDGLGEVSVSLESADHNGARVWRTRRPRAAERPSAKSGPSASRGGAHFANSEAHGGAFTSKLD